MADLVVIKRFLYRYKAEHAQSLLKDNGIDSIVQADDLGGYRPHLNFGRDNVRLLVRQEDAQKAQEVLGILDGAVPEADLEKAYQSAPDVNIHSESCKTISLPSIKNVLSFAAVALLIWMILHLYNNQEPSWNSSFVRGSHYVIKIESKGNALIDEENTKRTKKIYKRRLEGLGLKRKERIVRIQGDRTIVIQLPSTPLSDSTKRMLFKTAKLEFALVEDDPGLMKAALDGDVPPGFIVKGLKRNDGIEQILLSEDATLKSSTIQDAVVEMDNVFNTPHIMLIFNKEGANRFAQITRSNVGKRLAIILDGKILSAPQIREPILSGRAQITGNFTEQEATLLAAALRAGALPADITVVESAPLTKEMWLGK